MTSPICLLRWYLKTRRLGTKKDNQHYCGVSFTTSLKFVSWRRNGKRYKSSHCWDGRVDKLRGLYFCLLKIWRKGKEMDLVGLKLLIETSDPSCTQRSTRSASLVLHYHTQNKEILEASCPWILTATDNIQSLSRNENICSIFSEAVREAAKNSWESYLC